MAISRHHAYCVAPALLAQSCAMAAAAYCLWVSHDFGPLAVPAYAKNHPTAWVLFIAFWWCLFLATTLWGLLATRPRHVWVPIAAGLWQLYYFTNNTRLLSDHITDLSELFSIRASDFASPLLLPFVTLAAAGVVVVPTLGLRAHQLLAALETARRPTRRCS